jgi:hypothetical protein
VTTICVVSNTIGIIVGFLLQMFFIEDKSIGEEFKGQVGTYLWGEMIVNGVLCLPVIFFMRSRPTIPPR